MTLKSTVYFRISYFSGDPKYHVNIHYSLDPPESPLNSRRRSFGKELIRQVEEGSSCERNYELETNLIHRY